MGEIQFSASSVVVAKTLVSIPGQRKVDFAGVGLEPNRALNGRIRELTTCGSVIVAPKEKR